MLIANAMPVPMLGTTAYTIASALAVHKRTERRVQGYRVHGYKDLGACNFRPGAHRTLEPLNPSPPSSRKKNMGPSGEAILTSPDPGQIVSAPVVAS